MAFNNFGGDVAASATHRTTPLLNSGDKRSNKKLIQNALTYVCLAGGALKNEREAAQGQLYASPATHFIIVLKRERALKFGALYVLHEVSTHAKLFFVCFRGMCESSFAFSRVDINARGC